MLGREFLRAARHLMSANNEPSWRGAVVHAYYALFLECRDRLASWGAIVPSRNQPHNWVRLQLQYAQHPELKDLGDRLEDLLRVRNRASYDLGTQPAFATALVPQRIISEVDASVVLLDAIESDLARRAAAIASLLP